MRRRKEEAIKKVSFCINTKTRTNNNIDIKTQRWRRRMESVEGYIFRVMAKFADKYERISEEAQSKLWLDTREIIRDEQQSHKHFILGNFDDDERKRRLFNIEMKVLNKCAWTLWRYVVRYSRRMRKNKKLQEKFDQYRNQQEEHHIAILEQQELAADLLHEDFLWRQWMERLQQEEFNQYRKQQEDIQIAILEQREFEDDMKHEEILLRQRQQQLE